MPWITFRCAKGEGGGGGKSRQAERAAYEARATGRFEAGREIGRFWRQMVSDKWPTSSANGLSSGQMGVRETGQLCWFRAWHQAPNGLPRTSPSRIKPRGRTKASRPETVLPDLTCPSGPFANRVGHLSETICRRSRPVALCCNRPAGRSASYAAACALSATKFRSSSLKPPNRSAT
jgi:hypothetical protein